MAHYNHTAIEKKWREHWEKNPVNVNDGKKEKYYCLDMFPYPSGSGLHVGHWRGYVISDVWSRYQLLKRQVRHPSHGMGCLRPSGGELCHQDGRASGHLHGGEREEYQTVRSTRSRPSTTGIWRSTPRIPEFYKWTQWIFVQMFKEGLAYEKEFPINWCPSCKTGLANEEVVNGCCERCGTAVTKKNLSQWMLKITAYAERLLKRPGQAGLAGEGEEDADRLDRQILRRGGGFPSGGTGREDHRLHHQTRHASTAPPSWCWLRSMRWRRALATDETREAVEKYIFDASMKSNVDRLQDKEKTGVFTGSYAINPLNGAKVPIWLSDYVLADYGTGAIMCVPAHDDRDFEFAKKFDIPIVQVIAKDGKEIENMTEAYTEASGTMINSGEWNGMESAVLKTGSPGDD